MKSTQLHEHQGGFSDCRIWPLYIGYSMIGLALISAFGSFGAFALVVLTYGIFVPAYSYVTRRRLKDLALASAEARKMRVKRSYSLPSFSLQGILVGFHLRKKAA